MTEKILTQQTPHPLSKVRPKQSAKEIGISLSWLYALIKKGVLPKMQPIYPGSKAVAYTRAQQDEILTGRSFNAEINNHDQ